ncbi:MAG: 5-fold beta-flower protein [Minisyncoccales bacterium]
MIKIVDNDILREGQKIGYIDGNDIRDQSGQKLGYFTSDTVYDAMSRVVARLKDNYVFIGSRQVALQAVLRKVISNYYSNIARAAVAVLFGEI